MLNERLLVNDKNIPAHYLKSLCLLMLGRYDEVINYFDTIPKDVVIIGEKTGAIGLAYVLKKDRDNSAKYLELLREQAKDTNGFTADSYLYLMYALAAENDKAFEWVEQAIKNKAALLMIRYADPLAKNLREDPRFEKFHKQIFETDPEPESEDAKKKKALLDSETIAVFTDKLLNHMTENKPYLDAGLSLRSLAKQIDIHPNQLSWLLNESIGMNFNDYINRHRIETFKTLAKDPKHSNITIMGLAYDSGFNSKTVFNNCFKKETGLTPKQFLKRQQIKSPYTEDPF
jgi:AraC-like DNA-binding protein